MSFALALVQTKLFAAIDDVLRWIDDGKVSVNGEKLRRPPQLKAGASYAIELHGKKLRGKWILSVPVPPASEYVLRGPI